MFPQVLTYLQHLQSPERCRQSCSADCYQILDSAPTVRSLCQPTTLEDLYSFKQFETHTYLLSIFVTYHN